jgi:cell division protein FtsL
VLRIVNTMLVAAVLVAGFLIYSLEHRTRGAERWIATINDQLGEEREAMKLLTAEWSFLTRPVRLERLARGELGLAPVDVLQLARPDEVAGRLAERPPENPAESSKDPIADMLEVLQ